MKFFLFYAKFLVLVFCLSFGISAQAYIPPSQYIVKGWVSKHAGMKALKVRSIVTAFKSEKPTSTHIRVTTVYSADNQKFKSWATDDLEKVLYSTERDISSFSPLSKILYTSDLKEVLKTLEQSGVPLKTETELLKLKTELERREAEQESLVKWNGSLAWVLGQASSKQEPESPQLWFEKDLFLPVRFLYRVSTAGELNDIRLENYKFTHEFPYPRSVTLYKKGVGIVLTEQLIDVVLNADVPALRKNLGGGFTELGKNSPAEIQNLIQNYYDIIR